MMLVKIKVGVVLAGELQLINLRVDFMRKFSNVNICHEAHGIDPEK